MGNILFKIQRNVWSHISDLDEIHKTDNNLELYLNDVYEKECVFKASQEEVEFIQTGIETLVQDIVDEALDKFSTHKKIDEIFDDKKHKTEIEKYFERDLIDVYFPIRKGSRFQDLTDIKSTRSSIIKVGSFYEGTRNKFPDEFDFIFLLFCGRRKLYPSLWFGIQPAVNWCIQSVIGRKPFHYASPNGTRNIYLDYEKGIEQHGPAYLLDFIYKNGLTKRRHISVDLVPAYKIAVINKPAWYVKYVNDYVKPKSFHHEILSAESSFVVDEYISFTETEVSFIRNVLSRHHVKVYRILKFLINGHGDDETVGNCLKHEMRHKKISSIYELPYTAYSSYQIKTMMIYHHDECRNSDTTDIGPCVLQVLEELCKYKYMDEFPVFSDSGGKDGSCLVDYLQSVIDTLKSMLTRTDSYSYKMDKIKSVSMQFMEQEHMDWLERYHRYSIQMY